MERFYFKIIGIRYPLELNSKKVYDIKMGKRGARPKGKVKIKWSPNFAYGIGLLVTDGNLSSDGRHINFTSKDFEQIKNFQKSFGITGHIGRKANGSQKAKKYFVVQFGDVLFYNFLLSIGLKPAKSLTLEDLVIPDKYFFDFLRGCFDGDGCSYSYWDKRWRSSFMFYISFASASYKYSIWLRSNIFRLSGLAGHMTNAKSKNTYYQLKYAKNEAVKLFVFMNRHKRGLRLTRKYLKIKETLSIVERQRKFYLTK